MKRIESIDILRGFALMCMVLVHFIIYFGNEAASHMWLYFIFNHLLGDWGAGGFLMIMGVSQVFSAAKRPEVPSRFLFNKVAVRALYLFGVGLLMLALAWGPQQIWQWDILTLMGFSTLVLYFCRFLPSWLILGLSAAVLVINSVATFMGRGWRALERNLLTNPRYLGLCAGAVRRNRIDRRVPGHLATEQHPSWISADGCVPGFPVSDLSSDWLCPRPEHQRPASSAQAAHTGDPGGHAGGTWPQWGIQQPHSPHRVGGDGLPGSPEFLSRLIYDDALPAGDCAGGFCGTVLLA